MFILGKTVGMKKSVAFSFFLIIAYASVSASFPYSDFPEKRKLQDLNRRSRFPIGINLYAVGPVGGMAITSDFFLTPKIAIELGAGFRNLSFDHAFTVGARYHVFGKTFLSLTPYIGIYTAFHHNGSDLQNNNLYVPVGLHKIKKNGFSWSAEVAWQRNTLFPTSWSLGFRLGYRFKTKKQTLMGNRK